MKPQVGSNIPKPLLIDPFKGTLSRHPILIIEAPILTSQNPTPRQWVAVAEVATVRIRHGSSWLRFAAV